MSTTQTPNPGELIDAADLARAMNVTRETVQEWTRCGVIPCYRPSRKVIRYVLPEVVEAVREHRAKRAAELFTDAEIATWSEHQLQWTHGVLVRSIGPDAAAVRQLDRERVRRMSETPRPAATIPGDPIAEYTRRTAVLHYAAESGVAPDLRERALTESWSADQAREAFAVAAAQRTSTDPGEQQRLALIQQLGALDTDIPRELADQAVGERWDADRIVREFSTAADRERVLRKERERVKGIREHAHDIPEKLLDQAIADGWPVERAVTEFRQHRAAQKQKRSSCDE